MAENDRVQPRLAATTHLYLDDLLATGTYGTTKTNVARALIEEGVRRAIAAGIIKPRTSVAPDSGGGGN